MYKNLSLKKICFGQKRFLVKTKSMGCDSSYDTKIKSRMAPAPGLNGTYRSRHIPGKEHLQFHSIFMIWFFLKNRSSKFLQSNFGLRGRYTENFNNHNFRISWIFLYDLWETFQRFINKITQDIDFYYSFIGSFLVTSQN